MELIDLETVELVKGQLTEKPRGIPGKGLVIDGKEYTGEELLGKYKVVKYDEDEYRWLNTQADQRTLVFWRIIKGLTQTELSEKSGIKQTMISRYENGELPSPNALEKLADGLNVDISRLFTSLLGEHLHRVVDKLSWKYRKKTGRGFYLNEEMIYEIPPEHYM